MKLPSLIVTLFLGAAATAACVSSGQTEKGNIQADRDSATSKIEFSGDSAYNYIAFQVAFGPRTPGTEAHKLCRSFIENHLRKAGAIISLQDTSIIRDNKEFQIHNIHARFNPQAKKSVMLLAHYDTRPWADQESDRDLKTRPIDGANDGASGVAVLLEIARHIKELPSTTGIEMLFVDYEDAGNHEDDDSWCIGSQAWTSSRISPHNRPEYAILLDMVGARDARFHREYFSTRYAKTIVDRVWKVASALGYSDRFPSEIGGAVNDDHIHFIAAGIPAIDIIECNNPLTGSFNPSWHTLSDNIDNIDPLTLKIVGEVILETLNK